MAKAPKLDANGYRKFGIRDKLAYAAGDLGCNMSFALKGTVQTFWLVFMMLETGLLSALLLVVQIWDAVNDPLIGSMIDNDRRAYRRGKFKQYISLAPAVCWWVALRYSCPSPMLPWCSRLFCLFWATSFGMRSTLWQMFPTAPCCPWLPRTTVNVLSCLPGVPSAP